MAGPPRRRAYGPSSVAFRCTLRIEITLVRGHFASLVGGGLITRPRAVAPRAKRRATVRQALASVVPCSGTSPRWARRRPRGGPAPERSKRARGRSAPRNVQRHATELGPEASSRRPGPRAKRRGLGRSEVAGGPVSGGGHGAEVPCEAKRARGRSAPRNVQRHATELGPEASSRRPGPRAKQRGLGRSEVAGGPVSGGGHGAEVPCEAKRARGRSAVSGRSEP